MAPGFTPDKLRYGKRLREARLAAGFTQDAAAKAVGTSRRHWIRWETGEILPGPAYRERIASALNEQSLVSEDEGEEEDAQWPMSADEMQLLGDLMGRLGASLNRVLVVR